jgi:hypothetical protein
MILSIVAPDAGHRIFYMATLLIGYFNSCCNPVILLLRDVVLPLRNVVLPLCDVIVRGSQIIYQYKISNK